MKLDDLRNHFKISDYSDKTVNAMNKLIDSLEVNFNELDPSWEISLEQLAMNFQILFDAYEDIQANGNLQKDARDRLQKNVSITLFMNATNNIQNILNKFGFTVMSKARVKQLMKEEPDSPDEFTEMFE